MDINFFRFGGDDGDNGCYFRELTAPKDASVVLVSAPWGVTSCNGEGAAYAPDAIIDASASTGLFDAVSGISLEGEVATAEIDYDIQESSQRLGADAGKILAHIADGGSVAGDFFVRKLARIDEGFRVMHESIHSQVFRWASLGKRVGVVGGDHAVSLGAVKAMAEIYPDMGILFMDAHCDMVGEGRVFGYSHRSVAKNILDEVPAVARMVMVGVRDAERGEIATAYGDSRVAVFPAEQTERFIFEGGNWAEECRKIVETLPQRVYISFDVDALSVECCPHTKSPVAGGLSFNRTTYLINSVVESGREIVGFDLTEVVPEMERNVDTVVGARLLGKLCCAALKSVKRE